MRRSHFESQFFNALSLHLHADYKALKALVEQHRTWSSAYRATEKTHEIDPEAEWNRLNKSGVRLLLSTDLDFPPLLREIPWPPFAIYVRGAPLSDGIRIAIVGTRKSTPAGVSAAQKFSRTFARAGVPVVSGLAIGIDAISHQSVLDAKGVAIGVLACGLDRFYPQQNIRLGKAILESGGTIISEYPLGTPTLPYRFIERNRLVSGLSNGIVIIEAPKRSGTISTARFALEQNREVFVIPGAITNPNYEGSHALIQSGAMLVTKPEDVLETLGIEKGKLQFPDRRASLAASGGLARNEELVLNVITTAGAGLDADAIALATKLPIVTVSETLTGLLLSDYIKEDAGRYFCG